jgi:outer membrane protein W
MSKTGRFLGLILVATALTCASSVSLAQEEEKHIIRAFAGYLSPSGDSTLEGLGKIELENTAGFGLGYEYKFSPLVGLAFDYSWFGPDVKFSEIDDNPSTDFNPATLGVMFHFIHGRVVDLYAGPAAAYIDYGSGDVDVDSEFTWDARVGLDIKIFKWLGVGASIEYIDATGDFDIPGGGSGSLDVKPIVTKLGASLRF